MQALDGLPFGTAFIRFLADHRNDALTALFQLFTFLGEIEGYVLLITLIYVAYDKRLAFRLAVLTLIAMTLNHALKTAIRNPRPFIAEGSHFEQWAVSPAKARDLATEFSTPSGHAMAGGAFYTFLYASVRNRQVRIAAILALLLTGLSRPYLGVHYLEDILLGWPLGIALAVFSLTYAETMRDLWQRFSHPQQVGLVVGSSMAIWLVTRALGHWSSEGQPSAFVSYAGFLTGIVVAHPLEAVRLDFDPRSSSLARKALRYALSVGMILGTLVVLDRLFGAVSAETTPLGDLLRFVRYALAGIVGLLVAPWLFLTLGWAEPIPKR
jgi:membrane-associated phospholipid phosphatase